MPDAKRAEALDGLRAIYAKLSPDGADHWPVVVKKDFAMWDTPVILEDSDLAAISAPTLVVSGDRDEYIPLEHTLEIYRALPNAQLLVLPKRGHATFSGSAERFNPFILDFLDAPQ
jgi:pimeloyl-ACP methyl ester carboxylesterase